MSLPIISADQRLAEKRGVKAAIFGASGAGKTTLLRTLNSTTTLFFDLEAGDLAIEGLAVDTIRPRTWRECRDFAVFIGGPNPALRKDQPYSQDHHEAVCAKYGDPKVLEKYDTVFIDSITVAGRLCFQWCKGQPEALSEKTGKPDVRGAYGLHGREMIAWLTHLQHTRAKNVIFVQSNSNLIPKGTLARVRLTIRPGGFDDGSQGWTGGYATRGSTGAVYLNGEFTVTEGQYARRKIFTLIGLYSPKGPDWANMGRGLVRGMLNSARGISDKDMSAEAQAARRIGGFADLDGIEFIARIDIGADASGDDKNEIRGAVTPDHRDYAQAMSVAPSLGLQPPAASAAAAPQPAAPVSGRPTWAQ